MSEQFGTILERAGRWAMAAFLGAAIGSLVVAPCIGLSKPAREPPRICLRPAAAAGLVYIAFSKPRFGEDSRWTRVGFCRGSVPDPFAKLSSTTSRDQDSGPRQHAQPTWPNQKLGNYRIASSSKLRVELWDSNR